VRDTVNCLIVLIVKSGISRVMMLCVVAWSADAAFSLDARNVLGTVQTGTEELSVCVLGVGSTDGTLNILS